MAKADGKAEWRLGAAVLWWRARWSTEHPLGKRNNGYKEEKREKKGKK